MADVPVPDPDEEETPEPGDAAADPDGHQVKPDPFDESNSPKRDD